MNAGRPTAETQSASLRKVAIVLSSLPRPVAAQLLASFDDQRRDRLRGIMSSLSDVDPLERKRALESFSGSITGRLPRANARDQPDALDLRSSDRSPSDRVPGEERQGSTRADTAVRHPGQHSPPAETPADSVNSNHPLAFLADVNDAVLTRILRDEHPQTAALVLTSIAPEQAARLLSRFSVQLRDDLIRRISRLGEVEPTALQEVAELLRARCLNIDVGNPSPAGGQALRAIMSRMSLPDASTSGGQSGDVADDPVSRLPVPRNAGAIRYSENHEAVNHAMSGDPSGSKADTPSHPRNDLDDVIESLVESRPPLSSPAVDPTVPTQWSTEQINRRLETLPPLDLCRALGRVGTREALLTLCGIPMKRAEKAISLLPKDKQRSTRAALGNLGPLQLSEIDRAKERVARASYDPTPTLLPTAA